MEKIPRRGRDVISQSQINNSSENHIEVELGSGTFKF